MSLLLHLDLSTESVRRKRFRTAIHGDHDRLLTFPEREFAFIVVLLAGFAISAILISLPFSYCDLLR